MTVAFDASSELERLTTLADPTEWTHTPVANPKGIAVGFVHDLSVTDHMVGATYGGVPLSEVVRITVASDKLGASEWWFVGSGIPTGPQTVSVDLASGAITDKAHFVAISLTGEADLEVVDFATLTDVQDSNPQVTLQYGGKLALTLAMIYSGRNSPSLLTEISGCQRVQDMDLGVDSSVVARQSTPGSSDFTIGWTALGAEIALVAMAISEVQSGEAPIRPHIVVPKMAVHRASRW